MGIRGMVVALGAIVAVSGLPALATEASATATAPVTKPQVVLAAKPTLKPGSTGGYVKQVQLRLRALRYDPGPIDSKFGQSLSYAVWAFQKVNGIKPTSSVGPKTWKALDHPVSIKSFVKGGAKDRVEVSLKRQLVVVYKGGKVLLITHTSTGNGQRYCSQGTCQKATTPTGNFRVTRKIKGWRHAALGYLYNPIYFYRGYALHGSKSVPLYPASHGCARIPMHTAGILPKIIPVGMRVYVRK